MILQSAASARDLEVGEGTGALDMEAESRKIVDTLLVLAGSLLGVLAVAGVYSYLVPKLPAIDVLKDVQLQVPLRVYSRDERLVAEFGEKRRKPLRFEEVPTTMVTMSKGRT